MQEMGAPRGIEANRRSAHGEGRILGQRVSPDASPSAAPDTAVDGGELGPCRLDLTELELGGPTRARLRGTASQEVGDPTL